MKKIIEEIIQKKKHVYFISPSFGDVAAYAGDLLAYLSGKVDITVVNIFTSGGDGRTTFSAKQYLKSFSIPTAERLYEVLEASDANALQEFKIQRVNLGFADALWRRKPHRGVTSSLFKKVAMNLPELESVYPIFATHVLSGRISREDASTEKHLIAKLREVVTDLENSVVFCPLGYGKHVDYLLVRNACSKAFDKNVIYCADISDAIQFSNREKFIREHDLTPLLYDSEQMETKRKLLKAYKQFENQEENYMHPEIYYVKDFKEPKSEKFTVEVLRNEVPEEFFHAWKNLWDESEYRHYFNSPVWFQASRDAFSPEEVVVVGVYQHDKLVAVLPLFAETKYGVSVYKLPGGRYFDRSPLLAASYEKELLHQLFTTAKELGSFYLSELDRFALDTIVSNVSQISAAETSVSPFWILPPDAFRFLAWRHKKTLLKKLAEEEGHFVLKVFTEVNKKNLETVMEIERESSKGRDFKDTFSDQHLLSLYDSLEKTAPGSVWFVVLYYKNEPICYNYGFKQGNVYSCCGTSFKLAYRQFAPGLLLTYLALPKLAEMGITLFDFSRGVSRYKRDFTPYSYQQYAVSYGSNLLVHYWLEVWDTVRVWLEHHPKWYERVRLMKHRFTK